MAKAVYRLIRRVERVAIELPLVQSSAEYYHVCVKFLSDGTVIDSTDAIIEAMANKDCMEVLDRLMRQVHSRSKSMPPGSYTTKLIQGGVAKMGAKILEEAAEVVEAAENDPREDPEHLIYEACDLIYHLWVLLGSRGISVDQLRRELERREGTSGLKEKASRKDAAD